LGGIAPSPGYKIDPYTAKRKQPDDKRKCGAGPGFNKGQGKQLGGIAPSPGIKIWPETEKIKQADKNRRAAAGPGFNGW